MVTVDRPTISLPAGFGFGRPSVDPARLRPLPFRAFIERVNPSLLKHRHVEAMAEAGQGVADGELPRVLVLLPPGYWKSEMWSRLFNGYYLHRHPTRKVGLVSHSANLAWSLSEEARNYFQEAGGAVRRETAAKRRWRAEAGGEMWAEGMEGAFLGLRYHHLTVDDPMLPEQAHSPTYQRRFKERFPQKLLSRAEPGASLVFVMQRLGSSDPVEMLYEWETERPQHWHVLAFDEIKSCAPFWRGAGPMGLPETCTLAEDWRGEGEVLAPGRFAAEQVAMMQATAGTYVTNAQRQQRPSEATGDFWRQEWFGEYDELPEDATNGGKDWDTAYTASEHNSASAYVESYRDPQGNVYVHDCDWNWYETPELLAWMKRVRGPHHIESKATGKSAKQFLDREKVPATEVPVTGGDKFARAASVQPVAEQGRVLIRRAVRKRLLEGDRQGLLRVTAETLIAGGPDLDLNDAFVQALHRHHVPTTTWII